MSTKFYYSYLDFDKNYNSDFADFKTVFPNATELDFILEISGKYTKWIDSNGKCKDFTEITIMKDCMPKDFEVTIADDLLNFDFIDYKMRFQDLAELINRILVKLLNDIILESVTNIYWDKGEVLDKDFREYYNSVFLEINDYDEQWHQDVLFGEVFISYKDCHFIYPFLKFSDFKLGAFEDTIYTGEHSRFKYYPVGFDDIKFKDFQFSMKRIVAQLIRREKFFFELNENIQIERTGQSLQEIHIEKENDSLSEKDIEFDKKHFSIPLRIAILSELGVIKEINKKLFLSEEAKYRVIHAIVGGNYDNIKKYLLSLKSDKISETRITEKHIEKAKDFINSKTL